MRFATRFLVLHRTVAGGDDAAIKDATGRRCRRGRRRRIDAVVEADQANFDGRRDDARRGQHHPLRAAPEGHSRPFPVHFDS